MTVHSAYRAALLFLILALAIACAASDKRAEGVKGDETASRGYTLVQVSSSPAAVTPVKGRLIGDKDGGNIVRNINTVLLDRYANVYVASGGTNRVVVFDSTGKFLREIGRDGRLPGEFSVVQSIAWYLDTLLVLDGSSERISKFSADGRYLGAFAAPHATGDIPLYGLGDSAFANFDFNASNDNMRHTFSYHLQGGRTDTTLQVLSDSLPKSTATGSSVFCKSPGRNSLYTVGTGGARQIQYPAPSGQLLIVLPDAYRLTFLNGPQDTARVVERSVAPQPVTDEEWRADQARFDEWRKKQVPTATCNSDSLARMMHMQVVRGVFYDSDAMLWVDALTREGRYFEQFDSHGNLMKRVRSVPRVESVSPYVRGNLMALVETDSLDVQRVRLYSIPATR